MGSTAVLLTAAVAVGSPSTRSGVQQCMNEHRARCAALETGLQRFMVDHMLQNVVIVGRMHVSLDSVRNSLFLDRSRGFPVQ